MRRATLWVAVFSLAWLSCKPAQGVGEEKASEEDSSVVIEIGRDFYSDQGTQATPMPIVPFDEFFDVRVSWIDDATDLTVTLSEFQLASMHGGRYDAPGAPITWQWDGEDRGGLQVTVEYEDGTRTDGEVVLRHGNPGVRLKLEESRALAPCEEERPGLVFFKVTLTEGGKKVFEYDPPWVKKGPRG